MASNPSVLTKLASALNRQDDVPNQELAQELADTGNAAAVQELVTNLDNPRKDIQSDCIKTLYELGYRKPELIASYMPEFVRLLRSRNNRLVWGGMIALGTIAPLKAADIWPHLDIIISVTESGSVITQDWGMRVLAAVAAADKAYEQRAFPLLKKYLETCRPKEVAAYAESILVAVNADNSGEIRAILEKRLPALRDAQVKRVEKVLRQLEKLGGV
ncbi:MAG TPA: hypothetical protein VHO69_08155 [Phototrophicaceae bacterium]|nr:hypothetical protein [Phototrophicaceae bacterium]